jgi:hypothetical protein
VASTASSNSSMTNDPTLSTSETRRVDFFVPEIYPLYRDGPERCGTPHTFGEPTTRELFHVVELSVKSFASTVAVNFTAWLIWV